MFCAESSHGKLISLASATKKMIDLNMPPALLRGLTVTRQGLVDTSFVDDMCDFLLSLMILMHIDASSHSDATAATTCFRLSRSRCSKGKAALTCQQPISSEAGISAHRLAQDASTDGLLMYSSDHGMPNYNAARQAVGLDPIASWSDLVNDTAIIVRDPIHSSQFMRPPVSNSLFACQAVLTSLYPGGPDTADPYVAGLLEGTIVASQLELALAHLCAQPRWQDLIWASTLR